ncbi:hypothetical protein DFH07DRAFT_78067 [Mycena maculata]|uniref:Uncharacterized protein n=1 Tax=Mycena maculata TaxID=230809 RepID=A0AAD7IC36_9AGAR|nr:hypothetical protein DFH07DRAFT_78067 [Mycena maculata]
MVRFNKRTPQDIMNYIADSDDESDPFVGRRVEFLDGKVDEALQNALSLQNQPQLFDKIIGRLQQHADRTLRVTRPIRPQPVALNLFVDKSMVSFPSFFGSCRKNIALLHHLQRYAACYVAYKAGYFQKRSRKKRKSRTNKNTYRQEVPSGSGMGPATIKTFLAGCHPSMSHLFEAFQRARITGEIHLRTLALRSEENLRVYLMSGGIAKTPLECEALVQGFAQI